MPLRLSTRPLSSVLTEIVSEVAYLVQTEIRLARAEIGEKISGAAIGGALLGAAAILLLVGLFVLMLGVVRWLAIAGLPEQWGFLLVGGVVVLAGVGLGIAGAKNLTGSALMPTRTVDQVRADFSIMQEQVK